MPVTTSCKKEVGRITLLSDSRLSSASDPRPRVQLLQQLYFRLLQVCPASVACNRCTCSRRYTGAGEIQDWHVHQVFDALPLLSDATLLLTEVSVNVFVAERLCDTAGSLQRSNKSDTTHASPLAEAHAGAQARKRIAAS